MTVTLHAVWATPLLRSLVFCHGPHPFLSRRYALYLQGQMVKSVQFNCRLTNSHHRVPGGVSTYGTVASLAGGVIMGLTMSISLLLENSACRDGALTGVAIPLVAYGAFAGLFGSLVKLLAQPFTAC